ncbi:hypothetical protein [Neptuniibacter sp.]|uniref:hypothetical protein n=1 Tax=Neptuniibacter sp. TaxID=1962643 RepID=UPI0026126923|nr:hypothetical protein [Neptuniibacter sp.]MCP4598520.1 hypothetical protein [Neptuniibacter sp.]
MSKEHKLNDTEIYCDLLSLIAEVEDVDVISIADTSNIPSALERLMLGVKYVMLDLEATRRECGYMKKLLEDNGTQG